MTVTYTGDVCNANVLALGKLLGRWKGSIWKAVYMELLIWALAYAVLSVIYYTALNEEQQRQFEGVCVFFNKYADFLPITFMLGFYVSVIVARWWNMFENLGWIDTVALYIANNVHGNDEEDRLVRRNLVRHLLFYQVMVYRDISICIRERFPTLDSCVAAGYITEAELEKFKAVGSRFPQYWTPIAWVFAGLRRAYRQGKIKSAIAFQDLQKRVIDYRNNLGTLLGYDWVPIPLLYSQVVSLSVRLYFIIALLGRQTLIHAVEEKYLDPINLYVPIMTMTQFIFYIGWLKVAEALLNPFGRDDDDFEINWLLDRNLEVGYMIIEERGELPLARDYYWHDSVIYPLYSEGTVMKAHNGQRGSAVNMRLRHNSTAMVPRLVDDEDNPNLGRSNSFFNFGKQVHRRFRNPRHSSSVCPEDPQKKESTDIGSRLHSRTPSVESKQQGEPPSPNISPNKDHDLHVVVEEEEDAGSEGTRKSYFHLDSDENEEDKEKAESAGGDPAKKRRKRTRSRSSSRKSTVHYPPEHTHDD